MNLNEKETQLFKKWLKGHLAVGPTTIIFTKKDGTERKMICTTNSTLVPVVESTDTKREKKKNEDVMPVYDIEAKAWKSFRWDSVKSVEFYLE